MRFARKLFGGFGHQNDRGSSLAEVLIGLVVLGIVGTSLFDGISTSEMGQRKMTQVAFAENALQIGSDKLAKIGFSACDSTNLNPYNNQSLPQNETITEVAVWSDKTNGYVPCSSWLGSVSGAQYKQQITIAYTDTAISATPRTRFVTKLVQDTANKMGSNCNYAVNPIAAVGVVAGDTQTSISPLSTTCTDVAETVWSSLTPNVTGISANIDPATFVLSLSAARTTTPGTYSLVFGAHDAVTATAAQNAALSYTVYPTIALASGTQTNWVALEGCGIMPPPSAEDNIKPTTCSAYNSASTGQRAFTLSGGNPAIPLAFQSSTSSTGRPWTAVNTPVVTIVNGKSVTTNKGVLTYDPSIAGSGTFPISFTAVGGGLANTMPIDGGFSIVTRPRMAVSASPINLTATSSCKPFKTSTNTCSFSVKTITGTGYIQRTGANGSNAVNVTFSSNGSTAATISNNGSFSYNSTTDSYSGTVSVKHNTAIPNGSLCFGKSSGSPDTKEIGSLYDYAAGLYVPVSVTVTC